MTDAQRPDLTVCDREPITRLDMIQPFGFLVALANDWMVRRASGNLSAFLEVSAEDALGQNFESYLSADASHDIRNRVSLVRPDQSPERLFGIYLREGGPLMDVALHYVDDMLVIEAEPALDTNSTDAASLVRTMIARLGQVGDLDNFYRDAARQVRAMTGFDRVMMYRFAQDKSGHVIAESAKTGLESFADLHFPATDIPAQARELYKRNPFRIISDIGADPVPVLPVGNNVEPLDLTYSITRAVSPVHIEYLGNMGVGASLSISILVDGELWGLIACHHYSPKLPSFATRTASELYGQMFSLTLESKLRRASAHKAASARQVADRMITAIAADEKLLFDGEWLGMTISGMIPCDGTGVYIRGEYNCSGSTPPEDMIATIASYLNRQAAGRVFHCDSLSEILPDASQYASKASGLLAIPISRSPRDYIMLFRQEQIEEVQWGGDPAKAVEEDEKGIRLSPRKSFEAFAELVRGRARAFDNDEIKVAETLRSALIEVVLRYSESAVEERKRANERQELLVAELNHRVRNILSLIRGLINQTSADGSVADYVGSLNGRVQSLANAHDKITKHNWGPGRLDQLFEDEFAAYVPGKSERISITGPTVWLSPLAFSTMALVIHEMTTNCAKYGALSDNGEVAVAISRNEHGDVLIDWQESGGPAVKAPERRGFGSTIIERTIPYDLGGTSTIDYALSGVSAHFAVPEKHEAEAPEGADAAIKKAATDKMQNTDSGPLILDGLSILLVEDNMIVAIEAEETLKSLGASDVHVASTLGDGYRIMAEESLDGAMLDVNLGSETSVPLAVRLAKAGVPVIFASGYGDDLTLQNGLSDAVVVTKPFQKGDVADAFSRALRSGDADSD